MTNSVKTLIAAAIVSAAGSTAFAGPSYIITGTQNDVKNYATVDVVRADQDGTLEVYNFHGGERGALLGSADVHAGANANVKVRLNGAPVSKVEYVLVDDNGSIVAQTNVNNYQ